MTGRIRQRGHLRRPAPEQLAELAKLEFLHLTDEEARDYAGVVDRVLELADRLDDLDPTPRPLRHLKRDPGRPPTPEEDPYNAVVRLCDVEGAATGPLAGLRIGVKDNLAVAGVPMTNGSRFSAFTPSNDSVVVERLLDAGGRIVAMLNMDDFAAAGTGETSFRGAPLNPVDPTRSAGGSSSGTGSAVASGLVDLGIGVDQLGSGRLPAAMCGVSALKATHGLIPSHGVTHIDHSIDHICPTARTVELVARATSVMAGHDDRDPQWVRGVPDIDFLTHLGDGVQGWRIGVINEASTAQMCEPNVLEGQRRACDALSDAGAEIVEVSVPMWEDGWAIAVTLLCHFHLAMVHTEGQGIGHHGEMDVARMHHYALSRRLEADNFAPWMKVYLLVGRYLHDEYFSTYLGKAHNLRRTLRAQTELALSGCDLLIAPTATHTAPPLLDRKAPDTELIARATTMAANTAPLDLTGHPALAVPAGVDGDGLPVSVQLIGRHFDDARTLQAGAALEAALG